MSAISGFMTRSLQAGSSVALSDPRGEVSYEELATLARRVAGWLMRTRGPLDGEAVAWLATPGREAVAALWGTWLAGGVSVPLGLHHPRPEMEHVLEDSGARVLLVVPALASRVVDLTLSRGMTLADLDALGGTALPRSLPEVRAGGALLLYTSGTTSRPKGVLHTQSSLKAQIESLVEAWGWSEHDRIPSFLPLHHVHGLVNVVSCALWSGARCDFLPRFDPQLVWEYLVTNPATVFMAVPTVYHRLLASWREASAEVRELRSAACRELRLLVSGSAALPVPLLEAWQEVSGHVLLERYGMTEIGMALSNPLRGKRRAGMVGSPLPGVEVRLVGDTGDEVPDGTPGEIVVRGPGVFREYWRNPEATRSAFRDGWFLTGDTAVCEGTSFRILGRTSVDILKSGGYKISALEIESVLLAHPAVRECAVVGMPDPEWGDRVTAAVVMDASQDLDPTDLKAWAEARLAPYKVPRQVVRLDALPRNALGKVLKVELRASLSNYK